jgi:solute:Na+ symporter, SSS family
MFAFTIESINDIWGWIAMGIGGGILVPTFLTVILVAVQRRWLCHRHGNRTAAAVLQRLFFPEWDDITKFMTILSVGFIGTIIGTLITPPTNHEVLKNFYLKTRPFGFWKPYKAILGRTCKRENGQRT